MKLKYTFLILILINCISVIKAQENLCGAEITPESVKYMELNMKERNDFMKKNVSKSTDYVNPNTIISFKVNIIRISNSSGNESVTLQQSERHLERLNDLFENAGVQFIKCSDKRVVDNTIYDFTKNQESITYQYFEQGMINFVYFNSMTNREGKRIGGYAYFPSSSRPKAVFLTNSSTTLIHELGHFFSLYHTHGKSNCGTTDELANGSNCGTAGDEICDTPADPNLSRNCETREVSFSCDYIGTRRDRNGHAYAPDTDNIMSYSLSFCRSRLSPQQYARIRYEAISYFLLADFNQVLYSDMTISNNVLSTNNLFRGTILSSSKIEASNKIINRSNVNYIARNRVHLLPGFLVDKSSKFRAEINYYCNSNDIPQNKFPSKEIKQIISRKKEAILLSKKLENNNFVLENEENLEGKAMIYPNPFNNWIQIKTVKNVLNWIIYNEINQKIISGKENRINTTKLKKGTYFIHIYLDSGEVIKEKMIK